MYKLVKDESLLKHYSCTISGEAIEKRITEGLEKARASATLKGFRRGHAPMGDIKKHYLTSVTRDAVNDEIDAVVNNIVQENTLRLSTNASVDFESNDIMPKQEGEKISDFKITVKCELLPEVENLDLKKVKVKYYSVKLSDEEIESELKIIAKNNRDFKASESEDDTVSEGDIANIDCVGYIDGTEFAGSRITGRDLEIGSNSFIQGFESGLIGAKKGETRMVDTQFPEEYHAAEFAGKKAQFSVTVNSIKSAVMPAIDDTLAEKFSFKSLAELKDDIVKNIDLQYGNMYKNAMKSEVFAQIGKTLSFDVPESMQKNFEETTMKRNKAEKVTKAITKEAQQRARLSLYLSDFAAKNNIDVTDEDFMNFLIQISAMYGERPADLKKFYDKNQNAKSGVINLIYENKIYEKIFDGVTKDTESINKAKFDEILKEKKASEPQAQEEEHVHDENCNHA